MSTSSFEIASDFKRGLKSLWAQTAHGKAPSLEAFHETLAKKSCLSPDPLSDVLAYLALKNTGLPAPPLVPRVSLLPVAELCQLALLWASAGEIEAASALAHSIPSDFPWLGCRENEYCEEEAIVSAGLLSRFLGHTVFEYTGDDLYFQALAKNLSPHLIEGGIVPAPQNPNLQRDLTFFETETLKGCFTFSGSRTSLGSLVSDDVEIRAFGPQVFPLSVLDGFGIRPVAQHGNRWASPAASPQVWFETRAQRVGSQIVFDLVFFGLEPSSPLAFSFYVKADSAQIGNEKLRPKTLQRYHGISKPIRFGSGLVIESMAPGKLEVIPLAGKGGYWDCEYLAAFEIHPINAKMSFSFNQS